LPTCRMHHQLQWTYTTWMVG